MSTGSPKRLLTLVQWAILLVIVPLWAIQVRLAIEPCMTSGRCLVWREFDFSHYYLTAERVQAGLDVYCTPFTHGEILKHGFAADGLVRPSNPPLLTLLLSPLAFGSLFGSWLVYTILGLGFFLVTLWIAMKKCEGLASRKARILSLLIVGVSSPVLAMLYYSQVQGVLLALILWAWILAPQRKALAGILIGITIPLKMYTAPLLAFIFVTRNYRMFLYALIAALIGLLVPQLFDARLAISEFIRCGVAVVSYIGADSSANQSIPGVLRSIAYLVLIPLKVVDLSTIKRVALQGGIVLWLGSGLITGLLFRNKGGVQRGLLAAAAFSILCAPVAWQHYYLFTWPYLIQQWSRLSVGTRLIAWFSFPLIPYYLTELSAQDWISIITDPAAAVLVFVPATVFTLQFLWILYQDLTHERRGASSSMSLG